MKNLIESVAALLLAVLAMLLLGRVSPPLLSVFNILSWVVLYFAVEKGEIFGAVIGTVCGLIQDSLSLGVFGIAGLTFTVLGWLAGHVARKIYVGTIGRSVLFLFLMSFLNLGLWAMLMKFIFSRTAYAAGGMILLQPVVTAVCVSAILHLVRRKRKERL